MPEPRHTVPTSVGIRVRGVIWPIVLPAGRGQCGCDFSAGAVSSTGRLLCLTCGQPMPVIRAAVG